MIGARNTIEGLPAGSEIAEAMIYNTSLGAANTNKVESYLAIKYGITLDPNNASNIGGTPSNSYTNSAGTTIYPNTNRTYWYNILGIGRDDNSGLNQKQSHRADDSVRIYLGSLATTNVLNVGSFASDKQFVVMGSNGQTFTNTGSTEYPAGRNILSRINREWKVVNTAFTGTFSIDIKMPSLASIPLLELLIDDDGDFTNAVPYTIADGLTFTYANGILTISGISNSLIAGGATKYITVAAIRAPGGVGGNNFWLRADAGVTTTLSIVTGWADQTGNNTFTKNTVGIAVSLLSQPIAALNYNPTVAFDGNSYFTGNTSISNTTQAFAVGKIANSSGTGSSGALIGSVSPDYNQYFFHTEGTGAGSTLYCKGSNLYTSQYPLTGTNNISPSTTNIPYSIFSEDLSKAPASNFIRLNGVNSISNPGALGQTPTYSAQPTIGSRKTSETLLSGSEIAEAIVYNTSLGAVNTNKVESYLAIKYGITLDSTTISSVGSAPVYPYTNSGGTVVYSNNNRGYWNKIIGIGRDDSTSLYQRQSHESNDSTRIYLNTLASSNATNAGAFSTDRQFVVMGNNWQSTNTGSSEYPAGMNISGRINREWKVTNTAFTGIFSVDIKTTLPCLTNTSDLVLLVDDDGDFTNAIAYTAANGISFSNAGGYITIGNISNAQITPNSTKYITLAIASASGGTVAPSQGIISGTAPGNLTATNIAGTVTKWQYAPVANFSSGITDIASTSTTLTSAQMGTLIANRYYRIVVTNAMCATAYSTPVLINIISGPAGIANPTFWIKTDAGITQSGGLVSQWNDQSTNAYHVSQSVAAKQPSMAVDTLNYYPTVNFNGNDTLTRYNVPYNGLVNVTTTGANAKVVGSVFTVGRVTPANGGRLIYQWSGAAADSFVFRSIVDPGGYVRIGTNTAAAGTYTMPTVPFNPPFIATALDTLPAKTSYHYYNNANQQYVANGPHKLTTNTTQLRVGLLMTGDVAEVITYATQLNDTKRKEVESYLAIKYGITLSTVSASSNPGTYFSSNFTPLWNPYNVTAYHNNVIGIARDDNAALYQKQSHTIDDTTRIYLNALQPTNLANTGSFNSDAQFVMIGSNQASLANNGSTEYPLLLGITSRIDREWRVVNTNFTGAYSLDIKFPSGCAISTNGLSLLVLKETSPGLGVPSNNFSLGAVKYNTLNGLTFTVTGNVLTIGNISTSIIPNDGSGYYITLATDAAIGGIPTAAQTICYNTTPVDLTLNVYSGNVSKWQYSNDNFVTDIHDIASTSATLTSAVMGPVTGNTYYRAVVQKSFCSAPVYSTSVLITVSTGETWTGVTSTEWNAASNWSCNYVPLITTDVTVPSALNNYPILSTTTAGLCHNINIAPGASVTVSLDTLIIAGTVTNIGILDATNGSIKLQGVSAQTIAGSMFATHTIANLIINNTTVNIAGTPLDTLSISNTLSFGNINNATLNTGGNLELLSDCSSITARVADITNNGINSGNQITGKAIVDRCIPAHRAWRLLTAPITNSNTIYQAWQNNGVYDIGKGTIITMPTPVRNGLDAGINANYSMNTFNTATQAFTSVSNTQVRISSGSNGSGDNTGYMLFVRGDRNPLTVANPNIITPPTHVTVLSSYGTLQTYDQVFTGIPTAGKYITVGNPYASPIDFSKITLTNLINRFYIWDANLNQVGGFIVIDYDNIAGKYISSLNDNPSTIIQSGQAFMVQTATTAASSITIKETAKTIGDNLSVFRPAAPATSEELRIFLNNVDPDNNATGIVDGTLAQFNNTYSPGVDPDDAPKLSNLNEGIGLLRSAKTLSIERRPEIDVNDTLYLKLTSGAVKNYQLQFNASNLQQPGLSGRVIDNYLNSSTALDLLGTTLVNFSITSVAASAATNRFMVVFNENVPLPVTFTKIAATHQNKSIAVSWNVANEVNIASYIVERSTDGISFNDIATIKAKGNTNYQWLDVAGTTVTVFYKIKSIDNNGNISYSNIAKTDGTDINHAIILPDNDYTTAGLNFLFTNMPKGLYSARLLTTAGQLIAVKEIGYGGGTSNVPVNFGTLASQGLNIVEIICPDKTTTIFKVKYIK